MQDLWEDGANSQRRTGTLSCTYVTPASPAPRPLPVVLFAGHILGEVPWAEESVWGGPGPVVGRCCWYSVEKLGRKGLKAESTQHLLGPSYVLGMVPDPRNEAKSSTSGADSSRWETCRASQGRAKGLRWWWWNRKEQTDLMIDRGRLKN